MAIGKTSYVTSVTLGTRSALKKGGAALSSTKPRKPNPGLGAIRSSTNAPSLKKALKKRGHV